MRRYDNYEFRCSAIGKIINKSERTKTGKRKPAKLTQSNKTYLLDTFTGDIHNVKKEITSIYFEKGVYCEEDGITLLNDTLYRGKLLVKNKERKRNGYIHGEADCVAPDDIVYDIKNAFHVFTFGKAELTWDYEWQLKAYCWLWGKTKARLFYCLNNMPEHLIVDEERKLFYRGHYLTYENEEYQRLCEDLRKFHNYDHMPLWERFKVWEVGFTSEDEERIIEAVIKARNYMNELYEAHMDGIAINKQLMGIEEKEVEL